MELTFENFIVFLLFVFIIYEVIEHGIIPLIGYLMGGNSTKHRTSNNLVGEIAEVIEWKNGKGLVIINGEYWQALSDHRFSPGNSAIIENIEGLKLLVRPYENSNSQ